MKFTITSAPVHNVSLRHFVQERALGYNLTGFVQYNNDSVVGEAQGVMGRRGLYDFEKDLWKGTPGAAIEWVESEFTRDKLANFGDGFIIKDDWTGEPGDDDNDDDDDHNYDKPNFRVSREYF
jgi:acylphosphatase